MPEGFNITTDDAAVAALARRVTELTEALDSMQCHHLAYTVMMRAFMEQLRQRYRIDTDGVEGMAKNVLDNLAISEPAGSLLTPDTISGAQKIVTEMFKPMQAPGTPKRDKFAVIDGGKDGATS